MKKPILSAYMAMLKSGKYKKGQGNLRVGDCYCAMGVLVDLAVKNGIGKWIGPDDKGRYLHRVPGQEDEFGGISIVVRRWAGVEDNPPNVVFEDKKYCLWELNDRTDLNFSEIADLVNGVLSKPPS